MSQTATKKKTPHQPKWLTRRGRKGQVLPLGVLGLFIMVMAVIATMNLGQAVYQKIRLQNAADAAAYSLAAMEARAFNFIALTNRTQIVHYNTAMVLQSYLSYAGFVVSLSGTMRDMFNAVRSIDDIGCDLPPPVGPLFCAGKGVATAMAQVANVFARIAAQIYDILHRIAVPTIEAMGLFNRYAIWQMQFIRLALINSHLLTGMYEFVEANDDQMGVSAKNQWLNVLVNSLLNSLEFRMTFDSGAGINPFVLDAVMDWKNLKEYKKDPSKPEIQDAMGVMAEMVNASRSHRDVYNRSGMVASTLGLGMIAGMKMGQTKIVESGSLGPKVPQIRRKPFNYPVGDTLASDDYLSGNAGGVFFSPPAPSFVILLPQVGVKKLGDGIYADEDGGRHFKYRAPGGTTPGAPGGWSSIAFAPFPPMGLRNTTQTESGNHPWSPAPYFKFNARSDRNADYNQPSTWIFLNKHHDNFQTGDNKKPWHYDFTFHMGSLPSASLDTTIGGKRVATVLPEGINVIARGMAYYHRPGDWSEHPNFFNPFWRARLAPIGSKLMNVWDKYVASHITSSSSNQVIRGLVNMLRNLLSDFFFRTVTAVMTH